MTESRQDEGTTSASSDRANPAPGPRDQVSLLMEQAELLADAARYDEALRRLGQAAASAPGDARIHRLRARVLTRARKPAEALRAADTAVGLEPDSADGHFLRAHILLGLSRRRDALTAIREAHRLNPTFAPILGIMVTGLLANGQQKEAEAVALRCLELAPESTTAHDAVGRVALTARRWDQAEQAYRTLLRIAPTSAAGLNNLALICAARGDELGAMDIYLRALRSDPSFATARENLVDAAHGFLWGNRMRLPADARGAAWFAAATIFAAPFIAVFFLLYVLWFPIRAVRARFRWRRVPAQARELVAEHERRAALDAAATWGTVVGAYVALLATAAVATGEAGGFAALAAAMVVLGGSLTRVIPRVFRLDWPTRRRPHHAGSPPWHRRIRF